MNGSNVFGSPKVKGVSMIRIIICAVALAWALLLFCSSSQTYTFTHNVTEKRESPVAYTPYVAAEKISYYSDVEAEIICCGLYGIVETQRIGTSENTYDSAYILMFTGSDYDAIGYAVLKKPLNETEQMLMDTANNADPSIGLGFLDEPLMVYGEVVPFPTVDNKDDEYIELSENNYAISIAGTEPEVTSVPYQQEVTEMRTHSEYNVFAVLLTIAAAVILLYPYMAKARNEKEALAELYSQYGIEK